MDKSYEVKYHKIEEDYWWFIARREMISQLVGSQKIDKNAKILEIGCSGGVLVKRMRDAGFTGITGIDISEEAIDICAEKEIQHVYVMNGAKTTFQDDSFDLIIASDILEHIEDDVVGLREWRRILKPSGRIIVFVPAFQFLWSGHDVVNNHYRRYSRPELRERMQAAGFFVERASYWNVAAFFPVLLVRFIQNIRPKKSAEGDQMYSFNNIMNGIFVGILKVENQILRFVNSPFGVSVFTIGVKADNS